MVFMQSSAGPELNPRILLNSSAELTKTVSKDVVSEDLLHDFETYLGFWIFMIIICTGLITNPLNITVFYHQGFKDGVNISMTCIAFWDFLRCFVDFLWRLYMPISSGSPLLGLRYKITLYRYLSFTHRITCNISYELALYASIERCLCVAVPFKVKSVFTPKFTFLMVSVIPVLSIGRFMVIYFMYDIIQVYNPKFNATIPQYSYSAYYSQAALDYYNVLGMVMPFLAFSVMCISTALTIYLLRKSSKSLGETWGNQGEGKHENYSGTTTRERKVVKMLLIIVAVYIANLFPRVMVYIARIIVPEFTVYKQYNNLYQVVHIFMQILDDVNGAVNFFIFFSMSSKFKTTFLQLFSSAKTAKDFGCK